MQLGRAADVDWQLPDPQKLISSIHADIRYRDGVYTLRDKSKNGTYLNGARIDTPDREARLTDGDRIAIGHYELSVQIDGDDPRAASGQGGQASGEDVWGASDWGGLGAAPEPIPEQASRTPINHGGNVLQAAFDAPVATPSFKPTTSGASPWDSWAAPGPLAEPVAPSAPAPQPARHAPPTERLTPESLPTRAAAPPAGTGGGGLAIEAFLRGAGLPASPDILSNPAAMEQAGRTLRVLVSGLFDLLKRHGEMKSVLGIERTTVRLADNNTLKFSASAEEALMRLMMPRSSDLPGPAAAERSFDDVRRHEERLLTAMNEAVRRILEKLSPLEIKRRETGGVMDMFIPGARKASWWDELERTHDQLMEADGAKLDELIEDELRNAFDRHL